MKHGDRRKMRRRRRRRRRSDHSLVLVVTVVARREPGKIPTTGDTSPVVIIEGWRGGTAWVGREPALKVET